MKKLSAIITAAALFIIIWACSDYENTNPFHPDSENIVPLQNLTLQPQKVDHIQVIWDSDYLNENEGYKFRVDRKVGDGEWVEKYKLFNSDVYTFVDSAAGIDQTNEYRVSVAFDDHLSKPLTRSVFNEFYAPAGLDLTNINLNTVQLRWSDNSNGEDGFKIDRYSIGEWAESFVILGENTEAWTDSTVIPNDSVQYKISAFRSGVYSAEVLSERVNTNIPAPTNFRHEFINISTIKLSWTDNSTGEEGFRIEKRVAIGQWEVVHTALEDSTSWTDLFAEVGEVLQYRISAFKGSQASALVYSEGFNNPFPPPSNLRLSQLDLNTIRLDWADNSLGEEGFKIDKRDSTGNWQYDIVSLGPNTESWIDTPTDIYDTLAYRIKAFKGTATSNTSEATISDITFPPPSGLIVTREGLTRLRFDWTDNSVGEDLFIIDKQIDSENWIISYGTVGADVVTWTDSLANVDHELRYRIYGKAGSNFSNYAVSEVIDNSIPAPSNLQYEKLTISSIRLTWTDNSMDEHGFIIDKFVNGAWDTDYAQVGRNSTQWTDTSAEINRDIVYRIKAYYSTDYSDLCETGIINNTFPAPSNLTAQVTGMDITLNWTDNSIGEQGFIIGRKYDGGLWQDSYRTVTADSIPWTETVADTGKYYYRVKAYNGTDLSAATTVAEAWIQQAENEMILVPAGTFMMGSDNDSASQPIHEVTITHSYYMAKYETTQKEWTVIMGNNPASSNPYGLGDNYPVYYTTWYDILVYCNKRSIVESLDPCYVINNSTDPNDWGSVPTTQDLTWDAVECRWYENGYRLPTEAEWEYAARYNDGRTYPWSNTTPDATYCNFNNNIGNSTVVGNYSPKGDSQVGLCDMAGNVYEWCWDWYNNYTSSSQVDPTGGSSGSSRILKSGYWGHDYNKCMSSYRQNNSPFTSHNSQGFRVARNISTLEIPAPSNLSAEVNGFEITLNWQDNSNGEHGFIIDRKYEDNAWVENYAQVASEIITWNETVADTGKYYYRIKAFIDTGESSVSNELFVYIEPFINEMTLVPAGTFQMGQVGVAEPMHEVTITHSFYIAKYETTQKEWTDIMGTNPSDQGIGYNFPVNNVSWFDAIVYCNKRSIVEGMNPCYVIGGSTDPNDWGTITTSTNEVWDAVECRWYESGYRLPTEAEWEYTAQYNDDRTYPWGNTTPDSTYCNSNHISESAFPVGSFEKGNSQLGLCDMAGNVIEWVWDWNADYLEYSLSDPTGPTSIQTHRIFRGGGYIEFGDYVKCARRADQLAYNNSPYWGFRVARNNPADPRPVTFLKTFSSGGTDEAFSTIETQDGYLIAGCAWPVTTPMTTWIVKTNMHGAKLWEKVLYEGYCRSMIEAHDENAYLVLGYREESVGDLDIIITKIDDAGNELWCKAYNFSENDYGWGICKTNDGGYAIVGYKEKNLPSVNNDLLIFKIDGSGNQSWYKTYGGDGRDEGYSIKQLNNGDIVVVGRYDQGIDLGYKDVWMIKTDFEGNLIWDKKYDGSYSDSDSGRDVLPTLDGGYLITGSEGNKGGWIIKTDSTGNLEWDQNLGDFTESAMQKADGFFYITGIQESIDPYTDIVFIKIDSNGNRLFEKNYGREYEEKISDLKISSDNGFIITGSSANVTGKLDYILIKTDENGSVMGWK